MEGIAHESMWLIFMVVTLTMPGMRIQVHGGSLMFIDVQCGLQSKKNVILVSIQTCGDFGVMTLPPGSH